MRPFSFPEMCVTPTIEVTLLLIYFCENIFLIDFVNVCHILKKTSHLIKNNQLLLADKMQTKGLYLH